MRASYYELEAPRTLRLREEDLAGPLAPGELVATTEFTAVSPGTELAAWGGKPPLRPSRVYPRLVGYCNVAELVDVGGSTNGLQAGDYVLTHQSHRSAFRCNAADVLLHVRDADETDRKRLAAVYLYHLGYAALLRGEYVPGFAVGVLGAGALGLCAAQLVAAFGGSPIVFSGRPEVVRQDLPAAATVLPKTDPGSERLRSLIDMDGVDVVVTTSDSWDDFLLGLQIARKGGTIVCLGFPGRGLPPPAFNPLDSQYLYDKQLTIRHCGHMPLDGPPIDTRFTLKRNLSFLFRLLRDGRLDARPLLRYESPSADLAAVYDTLSQPTRPAYSALLRWRS